MTELLMTPAEAATYLRLSKSTLDKLRLTGGGPVYAKFGRRVVYRGEDLLAWFQENRRTSTSDLMQEVDHG